MNDAQLSVSGPEDVIKSRHFRAWRNIQDMCGHALVDIKNVEWVKRVGNGFPLFFAIHAAVRPFGENRVKDNEVAVFRPSTMSTLVWSMSPKGPDYDRIVLVKEYRLPVMNAKGFVYELPGGSSFKPDIDPLEVARTELKEETGIDVARQQFRKVGVAQCAPTVVAYQTHLVAAEITEAEMDKIAKRAGSVHGNAEETERTVLMVATREEIMNPANNHFGWELRGMIAAGAIRFD